MPARNHPPLTVRDGCAAAAASLQVLGDDDMGFSEDDFIGLFDETPMGVGAQPKREAQPSGSTTENTPPSS